MKDYAKILKKNREIFDKELTEFTKGCKVASILVAFGFIVLIVTIVVNGFN